jgi:hypothetical protein
MTKKNVKDEIVAHLTKEKSKMPLLFALMQQGRFVCGVVKPTDKYLASIVSKVNSHSGSFDSMSTISKEIQIQNLKIEKEKAIQEKEKANQERIKTLKAKLEVMDSVKDSMDIEKIKDEIKSL